RYLRGAVLPGSMLYSAVTQPTGFSASRLQGGTSFSMLAVHRMVVCPALMSRLPGAALRKGRSIVTGRSWSAARPSWRVMMSDFRAGAAACSVLRGCFRAARLQPQAAEFDDGRSGPVDAAPQRRRLAGSGRTGILPAGGSA